MIVAIRLARSLGVGQVVYNGQRALKGSVHSPTQAVDFGIHVGPDGLVYQYVIVP